MVDKKTGTQHGFLQGEGAMGKRDGEHADPRAHTEAVVADPLEERADDGVGADGVRAWMGGTPLTQKSTFSKPREREGEGSNLQQPKKVAQMGGKYMMHNLQL